MQILEVENQIKQNQIEQLKKGAKDNVEGFRQTDALKDGDMEEAQKMQDALVKKL